MCRKAPSLLAAVLALAVLSAGVAKGQPIGAIESPTAGQTVSGIVSVVGFVLDFNRVERVDIFVDGVFKNRAALNLPRIDVLEVDTEAQGENLLLIRINYRIRANNALANLVYPFYVTESFA